MSVKERLIKFIETKKLSVGRFERNAGLSNGFVNNIGDGIRTTSLAKIKKAFADLNDDWLLTGKGKMILSDDQEDKNIFNDDGGIAEYKLPASDIQPMQALMEIAASNRILAQAHDKQAEANRNLSEANKVLAENVSKLIENVGRQNFEALESRFGALLELLKEVSTGKRYDGRGAVEARYAQIWDTLMKADRKKNIQTEKGNVSK